MYFYLSIPIYTRMKGREGNIYWIYTYTPIETLNRAHNPSFPLLILFTSTPFPKEMG